MHDLTEGPVSGHLMRLAVPLAAGMLFQTVYYLVDLYFVSQLGDAAIAGVSAAGNVQFIVMALTQILGVGTMALIAHAIGRKDRADANLIFNQSLVLAAVAAGATLLGGYALAGRYIDVESALTGESHATRLVPKISVLFVWIVESHDAHATPVH